MGDLKSKIDLVVNLVVLTQVTTATDGRIRIDRRMELL